MDGCAAIRREIGEIMRPGFLGDLPVQAILGSVVPVVQFVGSRLCAMREVHRKKRLREQLVALERFLTVMKTLANSEPTLAMPVEDATCERDLLLKQLAAAGNRRRSHRFPSRDAVQRLLLLYPADRAAGWILRWAFYTLVITALTATVRLILHVNYLPVHVLMPALAATFTFTIAIRLAAFWLEQPRSQA